MSITDTGSPTEPRMTKTSVLLTTSLTIIAACAAKPSSVSSRASDATASSPPAADAPATADHAGDDDAANEVIAQLDQAVQAWHDSCPTPNEQGLCVKQTPADDSPLRCAAPMLGRVVVLPRDAELAASAQTQLVATLDRVVCESTDGCKADTLRVQPSDPALRRSLHRAIAAGMLARADAELESYFAITMPSDIDFFVEEWKRDSGEPGHAEQYQAQLAKKQDSERRFKSFFEAKTSKGAWLVTNLAAVKPHQDQEAVLRAALRTSWTALHMYDELHAAEVPPSLRTGAKRDAYCEALANQSTSMKKQAHEAAHYCTMRAAEHGVESPTVSACHELLARLDPPR